MPRPPELLRLWCDGLLAHQVAAGPDAGGLRCASHGFVHGRCADAIYPLLALFKRTGGEKYRAAARALYAWSERRVSQADGSWTNETDGRNDWKGITCFSLLSLGEALRLHGDTLTAEENERWRARLRRGADFLVGYQTFELGDINYPFSAAAALALTGTLLDEPRHLARARELAAFAQRHFTANHLIWGEGPRGPADVSPRGLRPIDLSYNIEESLPNLALYAELTHDRAARDAAVVAFRAHLAWMLPDGGWDAGWCSRLAKWSYWGSRTSDGCAGGFAMLRAHDPRFAEAAHRSLRLMAAHTHDGLLHPGPHFRARGLPACLHPTFTHAKGLAAALDVGLADEPPDLALPCDHATGVRAWPEAGVTQISLGPWRASITVNDLPSTSKRGGYPSGGALTMLWHARTGPLCVASMNAYVRYEPTNMDEAPTAADRAMLTPRLELRRGDRLYSSLHDGRAELMCSANDARIEAVVRGTLRDADGRPPDGEPAAFELRYILTWESFECVAHTEAPGVQLHLPVAAGGAEALTSLPDGAFVLHKSEAEVRLACIGGAAPIRPPEGARVFNFVPGVQAVPLSVALTPGRLVSVRMDVTP